MIKNPHYIMLFTFNFSTCFKEAANSISGKTSGSL